MKKLLLLFCFCFSAQLYAEEWKSCNVHNSLASDRDAAIAFGKIKTRISFFKKQDFASIIIFLDGKTFASADLIQTGRRLFGDGKPYLGYADKSNAIIVQDFENSDSMIVTLRGPIEFTMFAKCT